MSGNESSIVCQGMNGGWRKILVSYYRSIRGRKPLCEHEIFEFFFFVNNFGRFSSDWDDCALIVIESLKS